jgi:probable phosphoglycerate mutase
LAEYLAGEHVDAIYTSPMQRARQTAAPVEAALGLEVEIDDDLAEFDRDATEYVPIEELKAAGDPRYLDPFAGLALAEQSFDAFRSRVLSSAERIAAAHSGEHVAVVCHGGVINVIAAAVLGLDTPMFFAPDYTSINRVAVARSGPRSILTLNETPHLRGTDLHRGLFPSRR